MKSISNLPKGVQFIGKFVGGAFLLELLLVSLCSGVKYNLEDCGKGFIVFISVAGALMFALFHTYGEDM